MVEQAEAGAVVELADAGGDYAIVRAMVVKVPLTIRAAKGGARPVVRFNGQKGDNMVTIADGGELHIEGIAFSGALEAGKALAKAGISTAVDMIRPYNLWVDGCEFFDFGEGGFFAVKGTRRPSPDGSKSATRCFATFRATPLTTQPNARTRGVTTPMTW